MARQSRRKSGLRRSSPSRLTKTRSRIRNRRNNQFRTPKKKTHRKISDARLERGLRVLNETKDIATAARSIGVSVERFKAAAKRHNAIRKQQRNWIVVRRLPRKMPIFTNGQQIAITVNGKSASLIAGYMSAVRHFLKTNDPKYLAPYKGRGVKDDRRKFHSFEIDPNMLYRLSSAGNEPFEDIYRIVI